MALIPPVSGGAFRLSEEPLSLDEAVREVASDDAGAIATFIGTTRAHSRGREVVQLEYEAYEGMAEAEMERDRRRADERHDAASRSRSTTASASSASASTSVVIAVSSAHRGDALAACAEAIDTLKGTVPLWKKEIYVGGEEWIGSEARYQSEGPARPSTTLTTPRSPCARRSARPTGRPRRLLEPAHRGARAPVREPGHRGLRDRRLVGDQVGLERRRNSSP